MGSDKGVKFSDEHTIRISDRRPLLHCPIYIRPLVLTRSFAQTGTSTVSKLPHPIRRSLKKGMMDLAVEVECNTSSFGYLQWALASITYYIIAPLLPLAISLNQPWWCGHPCRPFCPDRYFCLALVYSRLDRVPRISVFAFGAAPKQDLCIRFPALDLLSGGSSLGVLQTRRQMSRAPNATPRS